MAKLRICNGVYFLHQSFLKEISENWITKGDYCEGGKLLFSLATTTHNISLKRITCNRTMEEINKSKHKIGFVLGILDLIEEQALPNEEDLEDDEYALKVASLKGITPNPTFFIVLDSEKEKLQQYAKQKGYSSINIYSAEDFDLD